MSEEQKEITLGGKEIDPVEEAQYREKIAKARAGKAVEGLKGSEPLGSVPRPQMPVMKKGQAQTVSAPQAVTPRPAGSPVLRPETAQQLQEAIQAGQVQEAAAQEQKALDEKRLSEEAKLAKIFEGFDFDDSRTQIDRILDNKKRKEDIEKRCSPMNFEDLLMNDEVTQRVPIQPGKFEPLFRSIRPIETLYLKQRIARETVQSDQYLGEKYNLMLLTCSLVDINHAELPDHRKHKADGTFEIDDALFDAKLGAIMRKSGYVVVDLSLNYLWFDVRVRKLLNPEDVKNG